jgi:hypothetical protein
MQWTISQIDQQFRDDKPTPTTAHWQCTQTDGGFTGSVYSTASVDGLETTTTQAALEYIWANGVDKEGVEKACIDQIASQKNSASAVRLNEAVSTPAPTTPLDQAKASALAQVDDHHSTVVTKLVGNPTQAEKDTWSMKLDTATAVSSGNTPSVAGQTFLSAAGISNADEQQAWAQVVLAKAAGYAGIVGVGEKLRGAARQAIKAANTTDEINAALEASIQQTEAAVKAFLQA